MENKIEIWKDIPEYEGIYQISNLGRVKSLKFNRERILKFNPCNDYKTVALTKKSNQKRFYTHRLIAIAFIPNPDNKPDINHINGIRYDNRIENLEWITHKGNINHAIEIGLKISLKGEKHGLSKLKEKDVLEIRNSNLSQKELSKIYKVSFSTVNDIINRKYWKHI